jgi:Tol biopolymer transport system component
MTVRRSLLVVATAAMVVAATAVPASASESRARTTRVSVSSTGEQGNGRSFGLFISAGGRYVAFDSEATNLVPGDTNGWSDVFLRDRRTGTTSLVSVSSTGTQGDFPSSGPSVSADGRYVVFVSLATNLVPGDTNGAFDVFVRDRWAGTTRRVSVSSAGAQGDNASFGGVISTDGRYVAFISAASNLVPGDTNGVTDAFVRDLRTGTTTRVNVSDTGAQANGGTVSRIAITPGGRYVGFSSDASNLVPGDTNGAVDVFVRDRRAGTTTRVNVSSTGAEAAAGSFSGEVSFSDNGRYVGFSSDAGNLVPGDTNGLGDVFVRDRRTGTTSLISVSLAGTVGNSASSEPALSADGRFVAFNSFASDLVPGDTNGRFDVFVRDRRAGTTILVSVSNTGEQGNANSANPSITANGRDIAFYSDASNLVPGDTNGVGDVFVRHLGGRSQDD